MYKAKYWHALVACFFVAIFSLIRRWSSSADFLRLWTGDTPFFKSKEFLLREGMFPIDGLMKDTNWNMGSDGYDKKEKYF